MDYDVVISQISGFSGTDACGIALRSEKGLPFKLEEGDSWALWSGPGQYKVLLGFGDWLTGCWYSPHKRCFFVSSQGYVTVFSDPESDKPGQEEQQLDAALFGVWGLSDDLVFAWGERGGQGVVFRGDGRVWQEMPAPPGLVIAMHGLRPDLLVAVGAQGLLARWDGRQWIPVELPAGLVLNAVWVVSEDEMFACGPSGILMEGSVHGWAQRLRSEHRLFGVARFANDLWLGLGPDGLGRLDQQRIEIVKPNIPSNMLDARNELVVTSRLGFVHSRDGKQFSLTAREVLGAVAGKARLW